VKYSLTLLANTGPTKSGSGISIYLQPRMGNSSSRSGQVSDKSHANRDHKLGEDSKQEQQRPEQTEISDTEKSSSHSDSEK